MTNKYVVYITYGVYVDSPATPDTDEGFDSIKQDAVYKMWHHGQLEVSTNCEVEIENVTSEFKENN